LGDSTECEGPRSGRKTSNCSMYCCIGIARVSLLTPCRSSGKRSRQQIGSSAFIRFCHRLQNRTRRPLMCSSCFLAC
jgi:hypothetical protein